MKKIVIIGNGIAGITAARHIRKLSNDAVTVISAESEYFFSRTALMYVYMGHMKFEHTQPYENGFWPKNNIKLLRDWVLKIDPANKSLLLSEGKTMNYDILIIATGSKPNKFGWPGENLKGVQGLYSKQDLDLLEQNAANNKTCKRAVIIGGGLIGIELAEMLCSRKIPVTMLVREHTFWGNVLPEGESEIINKHILEHHIDLRLNESLKEIKGDSNGRVTSVVTENGETLDCDMVGLTVGVHPNISFLEDSGIAVNKGVLTDSYLRTNFPDIYAIGDCAELREPQKNRKSIEAVWYSGRMMGETVAQTICGNPMIYKPGPWFNSAKFLDIEYQTYGHVSAKETHREQHLFWKNRQGKKCINIAFDRETMTFLGINSLGIRLRHEVFDKWLQHKEGLPYVLKHLPEAGFDPEFHPNFLQEISTLFQQKSPIL